MFRSITLFLLLLCCGISCVSTDRAQRGASTWDEAMQMARAKADSGEYEYIIENLLASECVEKASQEYASPDGWQVKYTDKHLKHLSYYFGWLRKRELKERGNEVLLLGEHGCFALFQRSGECWYLLDFGQNITSM